MLKLLRDKGRDEHGKPLHLGNRMAIDGLIATHAVIYDSSRGILYVSQGPAVAGPLIGYKLAESFKRQSPVQTGALPRDPDVSDEMYFENKQTHEVLRQVKRLNRKKKCQEAQALLEGLPKSAAGLGPYQHTLGDTLSCLGQHAAAVQAWRAAYSLKPAYASERKSLERKMQ
jgi:hypothetical protein